jgi:lichenan operon transcriptional antiterminator
MKYDLLNSLLNIFYEDRGYHSSTQLAKSLDVSEKTIQKYVQQLKQELEDHGATLEIKQGFGSRLVMKDFDAFQEYYQSSVTRNNGIFTNPQTRQAYVLMRLLTSTKYLKLYDLADELYISPSLLRSILHSLEAVTKEYGLTIQNSHQDGYRIAGDEEQIRKCLAQEFKDYDAIQSAFLKDRFSDSQANMISSCIKHSLEHFGISFCDNAVQSLVLHVMIAINRTETENVISMEENTALPAMQGTPEYFVANHINHSLKEMIGITLPESEILYLTMHISSKQRFFNHQALQFRVSEEDIIFYNRFLRNIFKLANVDLFEDKELRISLLNHIVPFRKRVKNGLQIHKSELQDIRDEFPYAYELALFGLSMYPTGTITVTEISYFALHLQLAIDKMKISGKQYDIVIVCEEVASIYQVTSFKLEKELNDLIRSIQFIDLSKLDTFTKDPANKYDLILNMTSKNIQSQIPSLHVSMLLHPAEIEDIRHQLMNLSTDSNLARLLNPSLFLRMSASTKDEALTNIIKEFQKHLALDEGFKERVDAREKLEPTDIGGMLAIPHPLDTTGYPEFMGICILDHPIVWSTKEIRVIFLICSNSMETSGWIISRITQIRSNPSLTEMLYQAKSIQDIVNIFSLI